MSISAYLNNPLYMAVTDEEARTLATVISDNGKVLAPGNFRYMEKPEYRNVTKMRRVNSNDVLYFYHIVVVEPNTQRKACYELIASETEGAVLRYRGMRPRIFTHFGLNVTREIEVNKTHNVAKFLRLLEEIKSGPHY